MRIGVLGPVAAWADGGESGAPAAGWSQGRDLSPNGLRVRGLLARLALDAGRAVSSATLIDTLWVGQPPDAAANALQALVSRLRRALGQERITTVPGGYRLDVAPSEVDALRFAELLAASRAQPEPAPAAELAAEGLALWRGPALADVRALPFAEVEAGLLAEQRAIAIEWSASLALTLGRPEPACGELAALLAEQPLRESAAAVLARCLAVAGRQADALAVLDRTRERLVEELGVDPGAQLQAARLAVLRGELGPSSNGRRVPSPAREPVRGTALAAVGEPEAPAAASGPAPRDTIPVALTSFVGRDADVTRVRALLTEARLVTLVGPGGAGKTRLAREVLSGSGRPAGRLVVAELAPLTGPDELPATVLAAVGTPEIVLRMDEAEQDVTQRLVATVGDAPVVLMLDNCEHLVDAAAALAGQLLGRCPGLRMLTTSREPLGIPGELLHPVEALDEAAALRLFVDRGRAVLPGFAPDEQTESVIAEICRRLDGQPLPIELAAARLRVLSPAEILGRLDDRFRLLTSGSRTLPRHQTLRAVVDWSWELLSETEHAVARRLAVFAGGATAEAAELVCADPGGYDVFDVLATLVDKSLVVAVPGSPTRYRMLETIREYAGERLTESGEREALESAHGNWVASFVERAEPWLRGPDQLIWLDRVQAEIDNVTGALRRAIARREPELAARLVAGTFWFWQLRGRLNEATTWIAAVGELIADPGTGDTGLSPALRSLVTAYRALIAVVVGEFDSARPLAEQAAALAKDQPGPRHPATVLVEPLLAAFTDDDEGPLAEVGTGHPDAWTRATALTVLAVRAENDGRIDDQRRLTRAAHTLYRATGDRFGIGNTLASLGELERLSGDIAAAAAAYEEAIGLATELGSTDDLPQFLMRRAQLAAREGAVREAQGWLARARAAVDPSGAEAPSLLLMLAMTEAEQLRRRGDRQAARTVLAGVDPATFDVVAVDQRRAHLLVHRAQVELDDGELGPARAMLANAAGFAVASHDGPVVAMVAECSARWALARGDLQTAARLLGVARTQRGTLDHGDPEVVAVVDAVRSAGAERVLAEAAGLPREAGLDLLCTAIGAPVRSGAGTA